MVASGCSDENNDQSNNVSNNTSDTGMDSEMGDTEMGSEDQGGEEDLGGQDQGMPDDMAGGDQGSPDDMGGDEGMPDMPPSELTFEEYSEAYLTLFCEAPVDCRNRRTTTFQYPFTSKADCLADIATLDSGYLRAYASTLSRLGDAIDSGEVVYEPTQAPACLMELRQQLCDVSVDNRLLPGACQDLFTGTIQADEECTVREGCINDGFVCQPGATDECYGTCKPAVLCAGMTCNPGEYCDASNNACAPLKDVDVACTPASQECKVGLTCVPTADNGTVCKPVGNLNQGDMCSTDVACPPGTVCSEGTCQSLQVRISGSECDEPGTGNPRRYICDAGFVCVDDGDEMTDDVFVCQAPREVGESCLLSAAYQCARGLFCDPTMDFNNPTCSERKMNGEECIFDGQCDSGLCASMFDNMTMMEFSACAPPEACMLP